MMNKIKENKTFQVRSDLACENGFFKQMKEQGKSINKNGIIVTKYIEDNNPNNEIYYNIDTRAIKTHDSDDLNNCVDVLSSVITEIKNYSKIPKQAKCLIIGLGNINITPDSLGPMVCDNVIITRHLFVTNKNVSGALSEVSAIAPGVMGQTGIETYDIVSAVIDKIDIDYIIVIDALAARAIERVNKTIQVTNAGIIPGSGVGNTRKELSERTIGKPVIAIGVPTVVDAVTITNDTIDIVLNYLSNHLNNQNNMFGDFGKMKDSDKHQLIDDILAESGQNMILSPKEIDLDISDLTCVISKAIDKALHPLVINND